jgi:alkanesulfonate monooxygenase SsuD/methylene tetrahydromethanopterin reductase-like flavin-dependent oxidoreductase (luciferase family)
MRLGAALPAAALGGGPLQASSIARSARLLEELGYESIWSFDGVGRGFILPDPLMALSVAATATERVEIGTGVLQLPIRNVVEVAHRALTLQLIAGGRFLLGVGPGSTATDFATYGGDYRSRFSRFEQQLGELREWLATGRRGDADLSPWPAVEGGPPLFLAGWRGRWVDRAATGADGWIASAAYADDDTLADAIQRFRSAGGRRAVLTNIQVGADVEPALQRLATAAELGFDDAVVFDLTPTDERLRAVRSAFS